MRNRLAGREAKAKPNDGAQVQDTKYLPLAMIPLLILVVIFFLFFLLTLLSAPDQPIRAAPTTYVRPQWMSFNWLPVEHEPRFVSALGERLATYERLPPSAHQAPKAFVFALNGYGDYCSTMDHTASILADSGFAVFCFDYAGFGRSEGPRGVIQNFNSSIRDESIRFVEYVRSRHPRWSHLPSFSFSGSLGGLVSISVTLARPSLFQGSVLCAPALEVDADLYPILRKVVRLIAQFFPHFGIGDPLDEARQMSADVNVDITFKLDPLIFHGSPKAITGVSLLDQFEWFASSANVLRTFENPFLLMHGEKDTVVPIAESERFFRTVASRDKQFVRVPLELHDLFHGPNHRKYLQQVIEWISARL